jgi:hypothetical protein
MGWLWISESEFPAAAGFPAEMAREGDDIGWKDFRSGR